MKKMLIFYPFLASYRIGLFNRFARDFEVKAFLNDKQSNIDALGFDINAVNKSALFEYEYRSKGLYMGRHLLSTKYFKLLCSFKPDTVLTHEFGLATIIAAVFKRLFGYTLFITCDDSLDIAKVRSGSRYRRILRDFVIKRLDALLTVSPESKQFFENRYPNVSCKFIYFPIIQDDVVLRSSLGTSVDLGKQLIEKHELGGKKIILFVGRFDPVKNIPLLVNAYSKVAKDDNVLILVGDGELKEKITLMVKDLGLIDKVIMPGSLQGSNLYGWYNIADVFVLPSYQECFGAVVNEALVAGCECVVSNKAGASCLINKENGLVFQSNNQEDLIEKLQTLLAKSKTQKNHKSLMPQTFEQLYLCVYNQLFDGVSKM